MEKPKLPLALLLVCAIFISLFACQKKINTLKEGTTSTATLASTSGSGGQTDNDCLYHLLQSPQPIANYLTGYQDQQEEHHDNLLLRMAYAMATEYCNNDDMINNIKSSTGNSTDYSISLEDFYNQFTIHQSTMDAALLQFIGMDLTDFVSRGITYQGHDYYVEFSVENFPNVNWNLPPIFALGTDVDYNNSYNLDYIPGVMVTKEGEECLYTEYLIGKYDEHEDDIPGEEPEIPEEFRCLENPLIVLRLSPVNQNKFVGPPNTDAGTTVNSGGTPGSCERGIAWHLMEYSPGGQRYERNRKSEIRAEIASVPITNPTSQYNGDKKWRLNNVHKNDINTIQKPNKHNWLRRITGNPNYTTSGHPLIKRVIPGVQTSNFWTPLHVEMDGLTSGITNVYLVIYERDWYAKSKKFTWGPDMHSNGNVTVSYRAKYSHQWYNRIVIEDPEDWCLDEARIYSAKYSARVENHANY